MSHTKGPWEYQGSSYIYDRTFEVASPDSSPYWIAQVLKEEDARLIAAALEMLEVLEEAPCGCKCARHSLNPILTNGRCVAGIAGNEDCARQSCHRCKVIRRARGEVLPEEPR